MTDHHDAAPPGAGSTKDQARALYEVENLSAREISRRIGVHNATISRWVKAEGWSRAGVRVDHVPSDDELEALERRRDAASIRAQASWAARRAEEADRAGQTAQLVRARLAHTLTPPADRPNAPVDKATAAATKDLALSYAIMVDKAQLLAGLPTGRFDVPTPTPTADGEEPVSILDAARARAERLRLVEP